MKWNEPSSLQESNSSPIEYKQCPLPLSCSNCPSFTCNIAPTCPQTFPVWNNKLAWKNKKILQTNKQKMRFFQEQIKFSFFRNERIWKREEFSKRSHRQHSGAKRFGRHHDSSNGWKPIYLLPELFLDYLKLHNYHFSNLFASVISRLLVT